MSNSRFPQPDSRLLHYLEAPGPHSLEIGAARNGKQGWLATDLDAQTSDDGSAIIALDATREFPVPSDSFDYVYSEHMIEHISFDEAKNMLFECNRILKPGGVLRVVTPSLGFLLRLMSPDRTLIEQQYVDWSVQTFVPDAPKTTNAFVLNNFMRNWGHRFIYDEETLALAMRLGGLTSVVRCGLNLSDHPRLAGLENVRRLPPGYLDLESMVLEGIKGAVQTEQVPAGSILSVGKAATQSSVSEWSREPTVQSDASRVVSGDFNGSYNCHTGLDENPWWRVDLGAICRVSGIRIFNRVDIPSIEQRMSRFELEFSNDDSGYTTVFQKVDEALLRGYTSKRPFTWVPTTELLARFVRIRLLKRTFLHLEQFEVYGYPFE